MIAEQPYGAGAAMAATVSHISVLSMQRAIALTAKRWEALGD